MCKNAINWDELPDIITKEQLYRICHISKSTALYPLKSGKIPCEYTGRQTRCYKIKKEDVIAYLENRKVFPESYSAPAGWYSGSCEFQMEEEVPPFRLEEMRGYYTDVMMSESIADFTDYGKSSVNDWCRRNRLKSFRRGYENYIPKIYLIKFLCSRYFRTITRKSRRHIQFLNEFARRCKLRNSE